MIEKANDAITNIKQELGDMPTIANHIIKFLNSKNRYELDEFGVEEKIETILEVRKVLTKRNLIVQLEEKCHNLEIVVNRFFNRTEPLTQKGLPSLFVINEKLITREDYVKKLNEISRDMAKF